MKNTILSISIVLLTLSNPIISLAQQTNMDKPTVKKIEVTGSAEQEVLPDEIYVTVSLKEYFKEKENKTKIDIMVLEKQLQTAVNEAGIAKENFSIGSIDGYREWWGRKKPTTFLESKSYILKVSNLFKIDGIISKVSEKGVAYVNIDRYEYSKIEQLRKEIKTKALQAAKAKAQYLLEGISEQLGEAIEITEVNNEYHNPNVYSNMALMKTAAADVAPMPESNIDVQKIKVRYEMKAVFKIK
jgi:uncharacterized protein